MEQISLVLTFSGVNSQMGDEVYRLPREEKEMRERINPQYYQLEDINVEWETSENNESGGSVGWIQTFSFAPYTKFGIVQNLETYCDFARSLQVFSNYDELYYWVQVVQDCCTSHPNEYLGISDVVVHPMYVKELKELIFDNKSLFHQKNRTEITKLNDLINSLSPFVSSHYRLLNLEPVFDINIYIDNRIYGGDDSNYHMCWHLPRGSFDYEKRLYATLKIDHFIQSMKNSKSKEEYHRNSFLYSELMRIYQTFLNYCCFDKKRED